MTTTKGFLQTSGTAAALFLAMIRAVKTAQVSEAIRTDRITRIMEAYQPAELPSALHPVLQLRRLRLLQRELRQ